MKPYIEKILNESITLRGFSENTSQEDLVWHRDAENRTIVVVEGLGWQFQRDNNLPVSINEGDKLSVRAGEYHRLIKGDTDLIVTIIKEDCWKGYTQKGMKKKGNKMVPNCVPINELDEDGMRSVRKGADKNPKVTKMDFLPDDVLGDIADDIDESKKKKKKRKAPKKDRKNPRQYDAPQGSSRDKGLDKAAALYAKGDIKGAARVRQAMEKPYMSESLQVTKNTLDILINDKIEEAKLDSVLEELEKRIEEKKKSSKSKKGLSKAVKKSLDKKADRRCLTRGSVYAEFRKGLAAFLSSGSRKGMSAHQWAHARVNSAQPSKSWAVVKKRKKCPKKKKSKK